MRTVYEFSVKDRKGKAVAIKEYSNEVLLIVNTATKCGFTPQYEDLEKLYERFHAQGFEILDFPCNQFGTSGPVLARFRAVSLSLRRWWRGSPWARSAPRPAPSCW